MVIYKLFEPNEYGPGTEKGTGSVVSCLIAWAADTPSLIAAGAADMERQLLYEIRCALIRSTERRSARQCARRLSRASRPSRTAGYSLLQPDVCTLPLEDYLSKLR